MPAQLDSASARALFNNGEAPFLLALSSALPEARASGIDVGVSALPPFENARARHAFSLVFAFFMPTGSGNKIQAMDLVSDYLTRLSVTEIFQKEGQIPVLGAGADQEASVFHELASNPNKTTPAPSFPEMRQVWDLLGNAEVALMRGEDTVTVASRLDAEIKGLF
jgi:maltose-binding protein MalE